MSLLGGQRHSPRAKVDKFAIEDFIDLKSVSTYGWRVDIERLRSKYFVDQMRGDKDSTSPYIQKKMIEAGKQLQSENAQKALSLLQRIQQMQNDGSGGEIKSRIDDAIKSGIKKRMTKPPLHKLIEEVQLAGEEGNAKSQKEQAQLARQALIRKRRAQKGPPPKPQLSILDQKIKAALAYRSQNISPVLGQYDPRYGTIHRETHKNVIVSKGDRFQQNDIFQHFLNKPYFSSSQRHRRVRSSLGGDEAPYSMSQAWAAQEDLPVFSSPCQKQSKTFGHSKTLSNTNNINEFSSPQTFSQTCSRLKRTESRGESPVQQSGLSSPNLRFEDQIPRKTLSELTRSQNPHESRFENFSNFTPSQVNHFQFEKQIERTVLIKQDYITAGGLSYHQEPGIECTRFNSVIKRTLPFKRDPIDYSLKKQQVDMRQVMRQRKKDRQEYKESLKNQDHIVKYTIDRGDSFAC